MKLEVLRMSFLQVLDMLRQLSCEITASLEFSRQFALELVFILRIAVDNVEDIAHKLVFFHEWI